MPIFVYSIVYPIDRSGEGKPSTSGRAKRALNHYRAVGLGKALGPDEVAESRKIPDAAELKDYPFYPAAQGEFHSLAGRAAEAAKQFEKAMKLARRPV